MVKIGNIKLHAVDIKSIRDCKLDFPFEKGIYALVGANGSGKSTIMLLLSQLVRESSLNRLTMRDFNRYSYIEVEIDGKLDKWIFSNNNMRWITEKMPVQNHYNGFYEGSIFYGTRFVDANNVERLIDTSTTFIENAVDADDFVIENLSIILHNDKLHYKTLKRLRTRDIANRYNLKGIPYFVESAGKLISQFNMSSGECMLITLLHFINNVIIRKNYKKGEKFVFLIDEVEIALHPGAIDRFITFFEELLKNQEIELTVYLSTHSIEIINRLSSRNIYQIECDNGIVSATAPSYPNYAIRNLYLPTGNGYDYLILVEDELTKAVVEKTIKKNNLFMNKLYCVIPSGTWSSTLNLHKEMLKKNVLGIGKKIISICDGDVKDEVNKVDKFKNLRKLFIPIPSIEKYLRNVLIIDPNKTLIKFLGDKYFTQRNLIDIIKEYISNYTIEDDKNGKNFYDMLIKNLKINCIEENIFIQQFCDDIYEIMDFSKFTTDLQKLMK